MFSERAFEAFLRARLDESIQLAKEGAEDAAVRGDQVELWRCRWLAALVLAIQGHPDSGIALIESYSPRSALGASADAQILSARGSLLCQMGRYREASQILCLAEQFAHEANDKRIVVNVLTTQANLLFCLGRHSKMHEHVQRIWEIAKGEDDLLLSGCARTGMGKSLMVHEHYREAIPWFLDAIKSLRSIGAIYHVANARSELGNCHLRLGELEEALALFSDALEVIAAAGAKTLYHINLANIGCVYLQRGELAKAISHYQQALAVARELNDKISTAKWLRNIALTYTRFGNRELADRFYAAAADSNQAVAEARAAVT
jgi:tetratricopeptide (TPR) repeat protein